VKKPKTAAERSQRLDEILRRLDRMYPNVTCALTHGSPWELLVATILSAQCTDKRVNEVTPGLFAKYPTPQDFAATRPEVLAVDIRSTGFFNNKTRAIKSASRVIVERFGGVMPRTMEELLQLPGVGRKTANVILNTAFGLPAIAVDTHIFRVANRTGLAPGGNPEEVERKLLKFVPDEFRLHAHHWLVLHGRYVCLARSPKCGECPIRDLCEYRDKSS